MKPKIISANAEKNTNTRNSLLGKKSMSPNNKKEKDQWSRIKAMAEKEKAERKKKGLPEF